MQCRSEFDKVVLWDTEPTRRPDLIDIDQDDGSRAGDDFDLLGFDDLVEFRCTVFQNVAFIVS